jgi:hypothetical protein
MTILGGGTGAVFPATEGCDAAGGCGELICCTSASVRIAIGKMKQRPKQLTHPAAGQFLATGVFYMQKTARHHILNQTFAAAT